MLIPGSQEDAAEFFLQLETFSQRARKYLNGSADLSRWGDPALKTTSGSPDGIVLHYTAGPTLESAVKWLCNVKDQCGSAHAVVADSQLKWAAPMMSDLPRIAALPATIVQLRLPNSVAFHATVVNHTHYGIEMANVGPSPAREKDPTLSYDRDSTPANRVLAAGQVFQAYTLAQLRATAMLGRMVKAMGGNVEAGSIVGHEHVQATTTMGAGGHDKRDPGVCFNFSQMRDAIVNNKDIADPSLQTLASRMGYALNDGLRKAQENGLAQSARDRNSVESRHCLMAAQLVAMGYFIYGSTTLKAGPKSIRYFCDAQSVEDPNIINKNRGVVAVFQRMMGLVADGDPGPKTQQALLSRLTDRWFNRTMVEGVA